MLLAETYQVARAMLRKLGDGHLAWIAADRAVQAGRHAEDPLLVAVGARALTQVFTETGQLDAALDISLSSAAALEPRLRETRSGPEAWSVWVRCCSPPPWPPRGTTMSARPGITCGGLSERPTGSAPTATTCGPVSGRPTSAIHGIAVAVELGDVPETIRRAEQVNTAPLPADLLERRANVFIDLGRAYVQRRDDAAATAVFGQAEELAPEEVHYSVPVREAPREMFKREHRYATPELRPLARRTGVIS